MELLFISHEIQDYWNQWFNSILNYIKAFEWKKDIQITVITSSNWKHYEQELRNIKIIYLDVGKKDNLNLTNKEIISYSIKAKNYANKIIEAKILLNKTSFDLVHCFGWLPSGYIGYTINKKYNIPYIITLMWPDIPFYKKKFEYIDKLLFTKLSKIIWDKSQWLFCESKWLLDLAKLTSWEKQIQLINPCINNQNIWNINNSKIFSILFIWKINETTALINLLRWFRKFAKDKDNVNLNIIGYGSKTKEIEEYIKQKVLYKKINFQHYSPELNFNKIYEKSSVFAIPYSQDYINKNILEAISYELPLIIDKQSSGIELFDWNWDIMDSCDYLDIASKIQQLYEKFENNTLKKMPYSNIDLFNIDNMTDSYIKIYKKLITK